MSSTPKTPRNQGVSLTETLLTCPVVRRNFGLFLGIIKIIPIFVIQHRGVEQLVARRAHNPEVVGSSPSPATKRGWLFSRPHFFISVTNYCPHYLHFFV